MSFAVSEACNRLGLRAGAIIFRNVSIAPADLQLRSEIRAETERVGARFGQPSAIANLSEIAGFQSVLRQVDVNPRKEQPSVERLLNYALKRGDLPAINNLVDAYNLVSVRTLCSLGAHDLDRIEMPVSLRILTGQESFSPLGQESPQAVVAGEFGYVDARNRVLCRLDIRQAEFSKVTAATRNILLIVEGTVAHQAETLRRAFAEVTDIILRYCGGEAEVVAPIG